MRAFMDDVADWVVVVCNIFEWFPGWTFRQNLARSKVTCHFRRGHDGPCISEYDWMPGAP